MDSKRWDLSMRQAGLTLIELMISLSVAAIVLMGVYAVYTSTQSDTRVTIEGRNLQALVAKVHNLYIGRGSYSGLSNADLINGNAVPLNMTTSGTTIKTSWNGTVTASANASTTYFDLTYASVPQSLCMQLVSGFESGFDAIKVGATTVKSLGGLLNATNLATACAATGPFTIVFTAK